MSLDIMYRALDPIVRLLSESFLALTPRAYLKTIISCSAGYPLISHFTSHPLSTLGAFNLGGINASGQVPVISGHYFALVDPDTPQEAWSKTSMEDGTEMELVFSDEFNLPGRTFYPGDDPYWEAVDLHYWCIYPLFL